MFSVIDVHESGDGPTYVEDVFSAFTYNGNGSTQSIVNGIDLAGKGGMVWVKARSSLSPGYHSLFDTARGTGRYLNSNLTSSETVYGGQGVSAFNEDGFNVTGGSGYDVNNSGASLVGWTFRKAKKFFDVKTYTGDGSISRQIAHDLGIAPGMIIIKQTDSTRDWRVYHRGITNTNSLILNTTAASASSGNVWDNTDPTDAVFTVGSNISVNASGAQYVAYIFAHDDSADGIIQCGTFTGNTDVPLGWEAQFVLTKRTDSTSDWRMLDTSRAWNTSAADASLLANTSGAETTGTDYGTPTSTGFTTAGYTGTYVYLAIRKGLMRPPTDASKVFDIVARTGTGAAATITTPGIKTGSDLLIAKQRSATRAHMWSDRLRGTASQLTSDSTAAETTVSTGVTSYNMDGVNVGSLNTVNVSAGTYINYLIKQARGFFDIVGYTGTGAARTVPHNLGAVPELMIVKSRSNVTNWAVFYGNPTNTLYLNSTGAESINASVWNNLGPNDLAFSVGNDGSVNQLSRTYIAYLFASCAGVSKIGTYTGTGAAQNIDCGFAAGARFVLIKAVTEAGGWYYWDSTRGIVSGNDPFLQFQSTAAETTTADVLAPLASGFTIVNTGAGINLAGQTYLYFSVS